MRQVKAKPDFQFVHPEYGDISAEVYAELTAMIQAEHEAALQDMERSQQAIAAAQPGPALIHKEFALKASIDPRVVSYWRMREGAGFWKHELDRYLKKHPECRVKQQAMKPTVRLSEMPSYRVTGKRGRWAA